MITGQATVRTAVRSHRGHFGLVTGGVFMTGTWNRPTLRAMPLTWQSPNRIVPACHLDGMRFETRMHRPYGDACSGRSWANGQGDASRVTIAEPNRAGVPSRWHALRNTDASPLFTGVHVSCILGPTIRAMPLVWQSPNRIVPACRLAGVRFGTRMHRPYDGACSVHFQPCGTDHAPFIDTIAIV